MRDEGQREKQFDRNMSDFEFTGLLALPHVRQCLWEAWQDSQPDDPVNRHEEGGYIVRHEDGTIGCERWPRGLTGAILPPQTPWGLYNGKRVIAEFHTHPKPPPATQGPSRPDLRGIVDDDYEAESYVISVVAIFRIEPDGAVTELPITPAMLVDDGEGRKM